MVLAVFDNIVIVGVTKDNNIVVNAKSDKIKFTQEMVLMESVYITIVVDEYNKLKLDTSDTS